MEKRPSVKDLAKIEWHYVHRRIRSPFYTFLLFNGLARDAGGIKFKDKIKNSFYLDSELLLAKRQWEKLMAGAVEEIKKDSAFFLKLIGKAYRLDSQIVAYIQRSLKPAGREMSDISLAGKLEHYRDLSFRSSASVFMIAPMALEKFLEESVVSAIKRKFPARNEEYIQAVSLPIKQTSARLAEINLLKLALKKKYGVKIDKEIIKHVKNYGWLKNVAFTGDFYSVAETEKEINGLSKIDVEQKLNKYFAVRRQHLKDLKKIKTAFKKDKKILLLIDTLQEAIFFRSWRTERFYRHAQSLDEVFKEAAGRIGCSPKDFFYLTMPEVIGILQKKTKLDKKELAARKKGYLLFVGGPKYYVYSGNFVALAKKKIDHFKRGQDESDIIRGQTAYPGRARGRARLVRDKKDFALVRKGEILIAPSTTPDYVPILKRVKAIVTNEGGVLSHASVISRELRIPCVIGTKHATRIIKTGDEVEVDADKGTIKIIK